MPAKNVKTKKERFGNGFRSPEVFPSDGRVMGEERADRRVFAKVSKSVTEEADE